MLKELLEGKKDVRDIPTFWIGKQIIKYIKIIPFFMITILFILVFITILSPLVFQENHTITIFFLILFSIQLCIVMFGISPLLDLENKLV